jgi:hypothetical protein
MSIINRDLNRSEKRRDEPSVFGALATGVTQILDVLPYNAILEGFNTAAFGISGSPVWSLSAFRFVSGGLTTVNIGATISPVAIGTSGNLGASIIPPGVSLLAGDVILLTTGGANSAVTTSVVSLYLRALDDIRVFQNSVG